MNLKEVGNIIGFQNRGTIIKQKIIIYLKS